MIAVLLLCAITSLEAAKTPGLTQEQIELEAIEAIGHLKPGIGLSYYARLTDAKRQQRMLEFFVDNLMPDDFSDDTKDDELPTLINAIEAWSRAHLGTKETIRLPGIWKATLTKKSPFLNSLYYPKPYDVDKPPVKIVRTPIPAGMVRLRSGDSKGEDLLRIYAANPGISEWFATVFKDPSRTTIQVPQVTRESLHYLLATLNDIGQLWEWAQKNFDTKAEQEAQIIKTINDYNTRALRFIAKTFIDTNIFEMIKAADIIKAPLALKLYQERLKALNKSAKDIKEGLRSIVGNELRENRHLWPDWIEKESASAPALTKEVQIAFLDLGLLPHATTSQIKAAYKRAIAAYDPSKATTDQKYMYQQLTNKANRAYEVLKKHFGMQ